ncbi:MAG: methyl-accepting chemotaxis protein [Snowella sp.]|jgi:twitching motility protein PilJ|nr:MAG: methyl-accepting chemotaxis protein [Snowella sp.]
MTATHIPFPEQSFPQDILDLQAQVENDPTDLVAKITLASTLEQAGFLPKAAAVYREIIELDRDGVFKGSAEKALEGIEGKLQAPVTVQPVRRSYRQGRIDSSSQTSLSGSEEVLLTDSLTKDSTAPNLSQSLADLPIASKQFIAFLTCSALAVIGVVGAGMGVSLNSGRYQLQNQAIAELAVTEINYNIKINQMGFGFRGQSDNATIIAATQAHRQGRILSPELKQQVRQILQNEINSRKIEYATLVGKDKTIIVNANADRSGQVFDPDNLVQSVLDNPRQIKVSSIVTKEELSQEAPPSLSQITGEHALIRYTATPVEHPFSKEVIGVLISGDVVNGKNPIVKETVNTFGGGYGAVYFSKPDGTFGLATSMLGLEDKSSGKNNRLKLEPEVPFIDQRLLTQAQKSVGGKLTTRDKINNQWMTIAVSSIPNAEGKPIVFLVRGTSEKNIDKLLRETFLLQIGIGSLALIITGLVARWLGKTLTKPIQQLQESAQKFGQGNMEARAAVLAKDEVGQLAMTFNDMADRIFASSQSMAKTIQERQQESELQRKQKEELEEGVIRLLLGIEEASKGDLTVKERVETGAVGAITDAFNTTISSLRGLVNQVLEASQQVNQKAQENTESVLTLSQKAVMQTQSIDQATQSVAQIAQSIESVSNTAQDAAAIARQGNEAAKEGQVTMDQTVNSIYKIRGGVAEISKKSKRLAESSQEISKIVNIISSISEKTNLLAFNASIEAARAGENGQGFRIVADEVRRLAEMVNLSAQEIEQVILDIQSETAEMTRMMEESTSEVVTGTQLVQKTKETLQNLATISQEIDTLLASISTSTASQRLTSVNVTEAMQEVAEVAKETSASSQSVTDSLNSLSAIALELQDSASRFKVN